MLYIYRSKASEGARDLAEAMPINCRKLSDLGKAHFGTGVRAGDTIICWGEGLNPIEGVKILNGTPMQNKLLDAIALKKAGVPTIVTSQSKPSVTAIIDQFTLDAAKLTRSEAREVAKKIEAWLLTPEVKPSVWLPRKFNHVGGADLLNPPTTVDYWSQKEEFESEFRIHCFLGKSIRAGQKVPREGVAHPHPWVRSLDGGWRIMYEEFKSKKEMRAIATSAVEALKLDFAAVDIGMKKDGSLLVLEANRAPGLEGGTINAYVGAITEWIGGKA